MDRMFTGFHKMDQQLFYKINGSSQLYRTFFGSITHLGGARISILSVLLLSILSSIYPSIRNTVFQVFLTLCISHLIMHMIKRSVKRIRPYLSLPDVLLHGHPFKDHSFPSGHSTAIFSITIPFMLQFPMTIFILFPISCLVAYSRVVLGVHYPSDVMAGAFLALATAVLISFL
ncbi:phosphatase PAP2 family protein [Rossellomorea aquimaris]|uniref:phosphatase PAP2 family protein n=1 Tax=Rossellomorea aquimaris TaxID=189382 RepID=UPI001CD794F8|nr:phosphatase PAP2 family protein [Rossellomorea aquimaris]MCA1055749.1 phosphatase PAP2 family protein [Rossellomorea aquimaris]